MDREFEGKSIILYVPNHFGLPQVFRKNLEYLGFEVFPIALSSVDFKMSKTDKFRHGVNKLVWKRNTIKPRLIAEFKSEPIFKTLETIPQKVDFALIIRPDLLSEKAILAIKEKVNILVGYQWDGLGRFPRSKELINLFDRFFVFDKADQKRFPTAIATDNFYFDYLHEDFKHKNDIYFVGTYMKDRMNEIFQLSAIFSKLNLRADLRVVCNSENKLNKCKKSPYLNCSMKGITFEESIRKMNEGSVLLDFQNSVHTGLSFRVFEAIGYQKKLITNNPLVLCYDFYDPTRVLFLKNINEYEIEEFLKTEAKPFSQEIIEKYSFSTWIKNKLTENL